MKTIIYTPETNIENEIEIIAQLLEAGADYLYIRKPELDDFSLVDYIESIPEQYWKQCVSTSLIITKEFNLGGYHFTRDIIQRNDNYNDKVLDWLHKNDKISSVSAHSIAEINKYRSKFKHVIVSPLFKSISKKNLSHDWNYDNLRFEISDLNLKSEFFAVGGINLDKIDTVKNLNFDGVGLLGAIWKEPKNAVDNFNKILHDVKNNIKA